MICHLLYVIFFLTASGSVATLLLLLITYTLKVHLPIGIYIGAALLYLLPVCSPTNRLFDLNVAWVDTFPVMATVWVSGFLLFLIIFSLRFLLAYCASGRYKACVNERVLKILEECAESLHCKTPEALTVCNNEAICLITFLKPRILISASVLNRLTDLELRIALTHELMHIRRRHALIRTLIMVICCLHWFNPIVWLLRYEIDLRCEIDCDRQTLKAMPNANASEYSGAIFKLMEISVAFRNLASTGTLDFIFARQRISGMLSKKTPIRHVISSFLVTFVLLAVLFSSIWLSSFYFYPYTGFMK